MHMRDPLERGLRCAAKIAHFLVRALMTDGIDEFLAHIIVVEAALGLSMTRTLVSVRNSQAEETRTQGQPPEWRLGYWPYWARARRPPITDGYSMFDPTVCLTPHKWETVSGPFGGIQAVTF